MECQAEEWQKSYGKAIEDLQLDARGKLQESTVVPLLPQVLVFILLELNPPRAARPFEVKSSAQPRSGEHCVERQPR